MSIVKTVMEIERGVAATIITITPHTRTFTTQSLAKRSV